MAKNSHLHSSKVLRFFRHSFEKKIREKGDIFSKAYIGSTVPKLLIKRKISDILKDKPNIDVKDASTLAHQSIKGKKNSKYCLANNNVVTFCNSIAKKDRGKYDFIYWDDIPINPPRLLSKTLHEKKQLKEFANNTISKHKHKNTNIHIKFNGNEYIYEERMSELLNDIKLLSDSGFMLFCSRVYKDEEISLFEAKIFETLLNNNGFYINAVFQQNPIKSKFPYCDSVLIISRQDNGNKFVSDLALLSDFDINFLTKPDLKKSEIVSYFDPNVDQIIIEKLKEGRFTFVSKKTMSNKNWGFLKDGDFSHPAISFEGYEISMAEGCEALSVMVDGAYMSSSSHKYFLITNFDCQKNKDDSLLFKSQILSYLRQHPSVLAYHSSTKKLGGDDGVIVYISSDVVLPSINKFFSKPNISSNEEKLHDGFFMVKKDFFSINLIRIRDQIVKSTSNSYQNYKKVKLGDLNSINDEENYKLMSKKVMEDKVIQNEIGKCVSILSKSIKSNDKDLVAINIESPNMFAGLRTRKDILFYFEDKSIGEYVSFFLDSEIGRQIFQYETRNFREDSEISVKDILDLSILIPENKILLETIKANKKISDLQKSVNELDKAFSQNPRTIIHERMDKVDSMLLVAGKLNKQDRVHSIIRGREKGDAEFKATWKLPLKKNSDHNHNGDMTEDSIRVEAMIIKVINSFINTGGGDLLIGVDDENNEIIGLEQEIKHYYSKKIKTRVKQIDEYDREFGIALRQCFDVKFIGKNNYISSSMVEMPDGKLVYHVSCFPSKEPCLIQKVAKGKYKKILPALKDHDFYIRKKSESIALEGQPRMDYILDRRDNWHSETE
jgi:hypothetical protein